MCVLCPTVSSLCIPVRHCGQLKQQDRDVLLEFAVNTFNVKYYDVHMLHYCTGHSVSEKETLGLLHAVLQEMRYIRGVFLLCRLCVVLLVVSMLFIHCILDLH